MSESRQALKNASESMDEAFARLEALIAESAQKLPQEDEDTQAREASHRRHMEALQDENFQLREENSALHSELQKVKDAYDALKQRSEKVAKKLDDTAEQLELMA